MHHFQVVYESLFEQCVSLWEIIELSKLRMLCKEMKDRLTISLVQEHAERLVFLVYKRVSNLPVHLDLKECGRMLKEIHYFGQIAQVVDTTLCVIAGSFALSFLMRLQNAQSFVPNDIDIFTDTENVNDVKHTMKKYTDLLYDPLHQRYSSNDYTYSSRSKMIKKTKVLSYLESKRKWKDYDWSALLDELPLSQRYHNHLLSCSYIGKKNGYDLNLIVSEIPFCCGGSAAEDGVPCKVCFAYKLFSTFDMKQCAVAIYSMSGTFYPHFIFGDGAAECIEKRMIQFYECSFSNMKVQLERIQKYIGRGYGLVTNSTRILRLS